MTVFGISMVKDEADIIAGTIRHMAGECDQLIVADNNSTDGTRKILDELAYELPNLTVVDDPDPAYYQSAKMTALANLAAAEGATWIVPFDADELWTSAHRIADVLPGLDVPVADAPLFNHLRTACDVDHSDPFTSMVWRQPHPGKLHKVAFRFEQGAVIHQGNHGVTLPSGSVSVPALEIRHYPVRSPEQFIRKAINGANAYAQTDLPQSQGEHWRSYGQLYDRFGEQGLTEVYFEHWWYRSPTDAGLVRDPAPYRRWSR